MFCPAPFLQQQALGTLEQNYDEAMAAPASKRAKIITAVPLHEVDVSQLQMKVHKDAGGSFFWITLDGENPRFNLTPTTPLKILFGLDMVGAVEQRSFNSKVPAKTNESLGMRVNIDSDLSTILSNLDKRCKELFEEAGHKAEWNSLVSHNEKYNNASVKLSVGITGRCTAMKVLTGDDVSPGEGWEFIKKHADGSRSAFGGSEAKAVVKLRIWEIDGKDGPKAGLSLDTTQLFVKIIEKQAIVEEDAFPEW